MIFPGNGQVRSVLWERFDVIWIDGGVVWNVTVGGWGASMFATFRGRPLNRNEGRVDVLSEVIILDGEGQLWKDF